MSLYQEWENRASEERSPEQYNKFWEDYFLIEKTIYEKILGEKENPVTGVISELAKKYQVAEIDLTGFIDGINSSIKEQVKLEDLNSDSEINLEIDYEKLYFNMHDAKADWLYDLPEWEGILSQEKRDEISKEYRDSKTVRVKKIGRNEPCPCGSGKKYKKCCGR